MRNPTTSVLALIAASVVSMQSAMAATVFTSQDLILGIRATGGTGLGTDFEMNIGQASTYYGASGQVVISGFNVADIASTFGNNWFTRNDLVWSVSGTVGNSGGTVSHPNRTMWVTAPRDPTAIFTQSTPWDRPSSFGAQAPVNQIVGMDTGIGGFAGTAPGGALSTDATLRPSTDQNSLTSVIPRTPGTSFGFFNPTVEDSIITYDGYSVNDLYEVQPGTGASTFEGSFYFDSQGNLTFDPAGFSVVPEPGAMPLLALGGAAFFVVRRRIAGLRS
jgi:hypothetical protein